MSKQEAKGIAAGLLFAGILLSAYYFMFSDAVAEESTKSTDEVIENHLEENDLVMIKKEEYKSLKASEQQSESAQKPTEQESTKDKSEPEKAEEKKEEPETIQFTIEEGMTSQEVAQSLEDKKLVKSSDDFIELLQKKGKETAVQPGEHELKTDMTSAEIITEIAR